MRHAATLFQEDTSLTPSTFPYHFLNITSISFTKNISQKTPLLMFELVSSLIFQLFVLLFHIYVYIYVYMFVCYTDPRISHCHGELRHTRNKRSNNFHFKLVQFLADSENFPHCVKNCSSGVFRKRNRL